MTDTLSRDRFLIEVVMRTGAAMSATAGIDLRVSAAAVEFADLVLAVYLERLDRDVAQRRGRSDARPAQPCREARCTFTGCDLHEATMAGIKVGALFFCFR